MSYFPVIIKTAHLHAIREAIRIYQQTSTFDEAFYKFTGNGPAYEQFSIMCSYLFRYHRDEYVWYIHSIVPGWDGVNPPPNDKQDGDVSEFTPQMMEPKPRIAIHGNYRG